MTTGRDSYFADKFQEALAAFEDCPWKIALEDASYEIYAGRSEALREAARKAEDDGRPDHAKVLGLLADACHMTLLPDKPNEPFEPLIQMADGRRSVGPDDFTAAEIGFFAEVLQSIDNPWLKGRLADLVWHLQAPRNVDFALAAIDGYSNIPLNPAKWGSEDKDCWKRAMRLCLLLGKTAEARLEQMTSSILEALQSATEQDQFFGLHLADTLASFGLAQNHSNAVADKLRSLAYKFDAAGDLYSSEGYFNAAAKWFRGSDDKGQSIAMVVAEAEAFVREADEESFYPWAARLIENAIQLYRSIPRVDRDTYNVDKKIQELRLRLKEYGERGQGQLKKVVTPSIDLSKNIEEARAAVGGKPMHEALIAFASLHSTSVEQLTGAAKESLSDYPFLALVPKEFTSPDGRTIARTRGLHGSMPSEEDESEIHAQVSSHYQVLVSVVVQAGILPALDVLISEHRFREDDLVDLARRSPIVPRGREVLFGTALAQGFNLDFATSIHLLTPQIEHMVRFHLKAAGVTTTHLTQDGIETENSLNALIDLPETLAIFKEDLAYEIKALFCDPTGPNLRNSIAHGLLDDQECQSVHAVYAWWLALKLVFSTFWNSLHRDPVEEHAPETNGEPSA